MDTRQTLHTDETFLNLLNASFAAGEKVYLLVDEEGIFRTEGYITAINTGKPEPSIALDNGATIALRKLVAVNGISDPNTVNVSMEQPGSRNKSCAK